mmetsp:Transcript_14343/g.35743  ORF Transcript_14343/g.35743 Transcript_14343/m.35743 type:complete len:1277 (-) Transcript_14343:111-3941(-)|eukprot:CAMPEP_0178994780 /NCGR_PEP_ID=MMETSP0795-20121207/7462_1 /TAXON_ID=88552 /ORGANISM="Amoebophrya sp., Strain Ameob2" /LENGTH=1276 /DNA_ID=CAMNT_0020687015 /DNA_START=152 /DNA_END=3982 /DNA_ORIENTATION=-
MLWRTGSEAVRNGFRRLWDGVFPPPRIRPALAGVSADGSSAPDGKNSSGDKSALQSTQRGAPLPLGEVQRAGLRFGNVGGERRQCRTSAPTSLLMSGSASSAIRQPNQVERHGLADFAGTSSSSSSSSPETERTVSGTSAASSLGSAAAPPPASAHEQGATPAKRPLSSPAEFSACLASVGWSRRASDERNRKGSPPPPREKRTTFLAVVAEQDTVTLHVGGEARSSGRVAGTVHKDVYELEQGVLGETLPTSEERDLHLSAFDEVGDGGHSRMSGWQSAPARRFTLQWSALHEFAYLFESEYIPKIYFNYSGVRFALEKNLGVRNVRGFHADLMHMHRLGAGVAAQFVSFPQHQHLSNQKKNPNATVDSIFKSGPALLDALQGGVADGGAATDTESTVVVDVDVDADAVAEVDDTTSSTRGTGTLVHDTQDHKCGGGAVGESRGDLHHEAATSVDLISLYRSLERCLRSIECRGETFYHLYCRFWLDFADVLAEIEARGVGLNVAKLEELTQQAISERDEAEEKFRRWVKEKFEAPPSTDSTAPSMSRTSSSSSTSTTKKSSKRGKATASNAHLLRLGSTKQVMQLLFGPWVSEKHADVVIPAEDSFLVETAYENPEAMREAKKAASENVRKLEKIARDLEEYMGWETMMTAADTASEENPQEEAIERRKSNESDNIRTSTCTASASSASQSFDEQRPPQQVETSTSSCERDGTSSHDHLREKNETEGENENESSQSLSPRGLDEEARRRQDLLALKASDLKLWLDLVRTYVTIDDLLPMKSKTTKKADLAQQLLRLPEIIKQERSKVEKISLSDRTLREIRIPGLGLTPTVFTKKGWPSVSKESLVAVLKEGRRKGVGGDEGANTGCFDPSILDYMETNAMLTGFMTPFANYAKSFPAAPSQMNDPTRPPSRTNAPHEQLHQIPRIYMNLNLYTETGRLACRQPNLQNVPTASKKYNLRSCFAAAPGNAFVIIDYSQLELRLLAHLANCASMLDGFRKGGDFHSRTALMMFPEILSSTSSGPESDDISWVKQLFPEERKKAKTLNFSVVYGVTKFGLAKTLNLVGAAGAEKSCEVETTEDVAGLAALGLDEDHAAGLGSDQQRQRGVDEAQSIIDAWYGNFPEVREWQNSVVRDAYEKGYVETILGRRRWISELLQTDPRNYSTTRLQPGGSGGGLSVARRRHLERVATNTPVQGSAADVVTNAMIQLHKSEKLRQLNFVQILQVHDELILEGPEEFAEEAQAEVTAIAESTATMMMKLRCPLVVDAKIAKAWS